MSNPWDHEIGYYSSDDGSSTLFSEHDAEPAWMKRFTQFPHAEPAEQSPTTTMRELTVPGGKPDVYGSTDEFESSENPPSRETQSPLHTREKINGGQMSHVLKFPSDPDWTGKSENRHNSSDEANRRNDPLRQRKNENGNASSGRSRSKVTRRERIRQNLERLRQQESIQRIRDQVERQKKRERQRRRRQRSDPPTDTTGAYGGFEDEKKDPSEHVHGEIFPISPVISQRSMARTRMDPPEKRKSRITDVPKQRHPPIESSSLQSREKNGQDFFMSHSPKQPHPSKASPRLAHDNGNKSSRKTSTKQQQQHRPKKPPPAPLEFNEIQSPRNEASEKSLPPLRTNTDHSQTSKDSKQRRSSRQLSLSSHSAASRQISSKSKEQRRNSSSKHATRQCSSSNPAPRRNSSSKQAARQSSSSKQAARRNSSSKPAARQSSASKQAPRSPRANTTNNHSSNSHPSPQNTVNKNTNRMNTYLKSIQKNTKHDYVEYVSKNKDEEKVTIKPKANSRPSSLSTIDSMNTIDSRESIPTEKSQRGMIIAGNEELRKQGSDRKLSNEPTVVPSSHATLGKSSPKVQKVAPNKDDSNENPTRTSNQVEIDTSAPKNLFGMWGSTVKAKKPSVDATLMSNRMIQNQAERIKARIAKARKEANGGHQGEDECEETDGIQIDPNESVSRLFFGAGAQRQNSISNMNNSAAALFGRGDNNRGRQNSISNMNNSAAALFGRGDNNRGRQNSISNMNNSAAALFGRGDNNRGRQNSFSMDNSAAALFGKGQTNTERQNSIRMDNSAAAKIGVRTSRDAAEDSVTRSRESSAVSMDNSAAALFGAIPKTSDRQNSNISFRSGSMQSSINSMEISGHRPRPQRDRANAANNRTRENSITVESLFGLDSNSDKQNEVSMDNSAAALFGFVAKEPERKNSISMDNSAAALFGVRPDTINEDSKRATKSLNETSMDNSAAALFGFVAKEPERKNSISMDNSAAALFGVRPETVNKDSTRVAESLNEASMDNSAAALFHLVAKESERENSISMDNSAAALFGVMGRDNFTKEKSIKVLETQDSIGMNNSAAALFGRRSTDNANENSMRSQAKMSEASSVKDEAEMLEGSESSNPSDESESIRGEESDDAAALFFGTVSNKLSEDNDEESTKEPLKEEPSPTKTQAAKKKSWLDDSSEGSSSTDSEPVWKGKENSLSKKSWLDEKVSELLNSNMDGSPKADKKKVEMNGNVKKKPWLDESESDSSSEDSETSGKIKSKKSKKDQKKAGKKGKTKRGKNGSNAKVKAKGGKSSRSTSCSDSSFNEDESLTTSDVDDDSLSHEEQELDKKRKKKKEKAKGKKTKKLGKKSSSKRKIKAK